MIVSIVGLLKNEIKKNRHCSLFISHQSFLTDCICILPLGQQTAGHFFAGVLAGIADNLNSAISTLEIIGKYFSFSSPENDEYKI